VVTPTLPISAPFKQGWNRKGLKAIGPGKKVQGPGKKVQRFRKKGSAVPVQDRIQKPNSLTVYLSGNRNIYRL
jgi:hypothetical protein